MVDAIGRLLTSCLSLITFKNETSHLVKLLIFANLIAAVFVPQHVPKATDNSDEGSEPLVNEKDIV